MLHANTPMCTIPTSPSSRLNLLLMPITDAGNFSAPKSHEIVAARGTVLELLRPDEAGRLQTIVSTDAFGLIRSLAPLRLMGQTTDYIIVGSDSGKISVLQYKKDVNEFAKVHVETFGKTGARRITPGQFVAREPHGRAIMVAALEKQKFVYVMNRDSSNNLTISSPLEAHKVQTIVYDVVGLDNGFENPIFACIEMEYGEADTDPSGEAASSAAKQIVYYELDLGVNNVVRKWAQETDRGANLLMPVPGDVDGPGGVLVACENWIVYQHNAAGQADVRTPIPRRTDLPDERGLLLVSWSMHKSKTGFFFLAQSELGDLYKITVVRDPATKRVVDVVIKYFDSIPVANSLCITRNGLLYCASEFSEHHLYQFQSLGDDDASAAEAHAIKIDAESGGAIEITCPVFAPRPLRNLSRMDSQDSLAPIIDSRLVVPSAQAAAQAASGAAILGSAAVSLGVPQILSLCGRGPRSTLRILKQGIAVNEIAVSPMPGSPINVFTLKASEAAAVAAAASSSDDAAVVANATIAAQPDKYIILTFSNATVALLVGDSVEEIPAKDLGFNEAVQTIAVTVLADGAFLQVYPTAMRMIQFVNGVKGAVREWQPPGKRSIVKAVCNERQVVLALSGGELVYFEVDPGTRMLKEAGKKSLGAEITALALGPVPAGRLRNPFVAVSDSNNMVRILSLDPDRVFEQASSQALRAQAESLAVVDLKVHGVAAQPHLFIGLQNGVLSRLTMDAASGQLSDPRVRFLGVRPVRLQSIRIAGAPAVLALSTRPYVGYNLHGRFHFQAMSYDTLESASYFTTEALPEAIVAVAGSTLRIIAADKLGQPFNAKTLPLQYTPRRMAFHIPTGLAVIAESDHNAFSSAERKMVAEMAAEAHPDETAAVRANAASATGADGSGMEVEGSDGGASSSSSAAAVGPVAEEGRDPQAEGVDPRRVGYSMPGEAGKWASCIRLVDIAALSGSEAATIVNPRHAAVHDAVELDGNEAAFSVTTVQFHDAGDEHFVVAGCASDMTLHPRQARECSLHLYRVLATDVPLDAEGNAIADGSATAPASTKRVYKLQLLHKTPVEDVPYALAPFMGRLLVGIGSTLRLFDLGKKRLLRKCEARGFPSTIQSIHTSLDRIFVGDQQDSIHVCKYRRAENDISIFADDVLPRQITTAMILDHETVCGADRFGNVFVLRLPADANDLDSSITGNRMIWDSARLNGAPHKLVQVAQYFVGSAVTSLQKAVLTAGGAEVVLYTTITGSIGVLMPLSNKEDADFFRGLEVCLRNEAVSIVERDHLSFRSMYAPVSVSKECGHYDDGGGSDGDMCLCALLALARQLTLRLVPQHLSPHCSTSWTETCANSSLACPSSDNGCWLLSWSARRWR